MKRYNTPHRSRVVKTRLTDEEYADFTARLAPYGMSQSEFIRQAITRATISNLLFQISGWRLKSHEVSKESQSCLDILRQDSVVFLISDSLPLQSKTGINAISPTL